MAGSWRTMDLDRVQLRTIFARTEKNIPIPSSMILIANGNGATHWSSISTILEISSFRSIKGNTATTFSADMSYNLLQVSTTGVRGTLESYVDPTTSTLMLSNAFPPTGVGQYPGPPTAGITLANATALAGGVYMNPVEGNSTMKFVGIGDLRLSTVTAANATFFYMSTVTAAGYSTISGETYTLKSSIPSTFSTLYGRPCFVSSLTGSATLLTGALTTGSNVGRDIYLSTALIPINHLSTYLDTSAQSSTRLFIDYSPNLLLPPFTAGTGAPIKEVCTFLFYNGAPISESVIRTNLTTYQITNYSNAFTTPIRMTVNPYTTLLDATAAGSGQQFAVMHRIVDGIYDASNIGFVSSANTVAYTNSMSGQNSLFVTLTNSGPLY